MKAKKLFVFCGSDSARNLRCSNHPELWATVFFRAERGGNPLSRITRLYRLFAALAILAGAAGPGTPANCAPDSTIFPNDAQIVANPSLTRYGSLPRNFLRGPGRVNFDVAIGKTTSLIGERLKMELRAELFNAFNHTEFANPDTNIQDQGRTFGQITQTGDTGFPVDPKARVIQLAVRFTF